MTTLLIVLTTLYWIYTTHKRAAGKPAARRDTTLTALVQWATVGSGPSGRGRTFRIYYDFTA